MVRLPTPVHFSVDARSGSVDVLYRRPVFSDARQGLCFGLNVLVVLYRRSVKGSKSAVACLVWFAKHRPNMT